MTGHIKLDLHSGEGNIHNPHAALVHLAIGLPIKENTGQIGFFPVLPSFFQADIELMPEDIVVQAKGDMNATVDLLAISGTTGQGVAELLSRVSKVLETRSASAGLATRQRHAEAMERAIAYLTASLPLVEQGQESYDIAAEEIRSAIRVLESLIGAVDVEDLLGEIFQSFCVGK